MTNKCCEDKHVYLLLTRKEIERHYVLIKDLNTFMYKYTLNCGREQIWSYCLKTFKTAETLKCHIKDCFKINGLERIKMPQKVNTLDSDILIYAGFESLLVPEDHGKQDLHESYTNKYQKHIAGSYGHKLVRIDDRFSKPFKYYLSEDAV